MRILIVDDSNVMRRIISNILLKLGYTEILEAANGNDALAKRPKADVMLLDWNMPGMDGLTTLKTLRKKGDNIPVIMVTTESGKEEVIEAIRNGVNDYIKKPFGQEVIEAKLNRLKEKSGLT